MIPFNRIALRVSWEWTKRPLLAWLVITVTVLSVRPHGWEALLTTCGTYYDAGNYTRIAATGYEQGDILTAFYPLWPILMRAVTLHSTDIFILGAVGSIMAAFLFMLATHITIQWLKLHRLDRYAPLGVAVMILSPLSVFRVLAFTESLYSLLLVLVIWEMTSQELNRTRLFLWTALLSLTRPLLPILMIAVALIAGSVFLTRRRYGTAQSQKTWRALTTIFFAAPFGYLPYGAFCLIHYGNFWRPFLAQKFWNRNFGLHWSILTAPKVINGSNEVLVWDLLAFYGPFIMLGWLGWRVFRPRDRHLTLEVSVGVAFAVLVAAAHSALAFLTHDRFMSLSRHVLANPTLYIAAIALSTICKDDKDPLVKRGLIFFLVGSCVFLGMWWARFAHDQWIG